MIINPVVGAFFTKYKLLFQILAVVLAIIAICFMWNRFIAEPYRDQGRAEIQAKWDEQRAKTAEAHAKELAKARQFERDHAAAVTEQVNQYIKGIKDENQALSDSIARAHTDNRRLRLITGTIVPTPNGVPGTGPDPGGTTGTCEARLPAEIGEAFERLQEGALRVGADANKAAIKLNSNQEILSSERK